MSRVAPFIAWTVFFASLTFFLLIAFRAYRSQPKQTVSPVSDHTPIVTRPTHTPLPKPTLPDQIPIPLNDLDGTYGVVLEHLESDERLAIHEHDSFLSASLYKLWVMATVFERIRDGLLSETDMLSQDVSVLNEKFQIASESAERTEGTIAFTVHDALSAMIAVSDNYAALLLTERVGLSSVARFLTEHGFRSSKVGTDGSAPTTTASDIALFFRKLYTGTLLGSEYDNRMLEILKTQKLNNKLPKLLPQTISVAHKTGELGTATHDAGIVYHPGGAYILVVLTDSTFPSIAEERIARLSRYAFDQMSGNDR